MEKRNYFIMKPGIGLFIRGLMFVLFVVMLYVHPAGAIAFAVAGGIGFDEEQQKELEKLFNAAGEKHKAAVKTEVTEALKGTMTVDQFSEKMKAVGLEEKTIENMVKSIEKQGLAIAQMMLEGDKRKGKDLDQIVSEQAEAMKKLGGSDNAAKVRFKVNADKTMIQSSSITSSTLSYREQAMGQLAAPNTVFDKVFRTVNLSEADLAVSNGVISYVDVTAETNSAAETAEHAGVVVGTGNKPESAITWQEYTQALRVIADTIPVTRNSYKHLGFIAGEIDRLLRKNQAQRKDTQIYKGDGIAPNIKGIYTFTTAVTLASLPQYGAVIMPNIADLAMNLATYVSNKADASGAQSKYAPNVLFINPADALKFLIKSNDGVYQLPPFMSNGKVGNLTIIESPKVTVNTLMVGDASYGTIYQSEDVVIEMGLVNDQFLKNQWTIRAEQELCFLQRTADLGAFTKVTDIAAAISALAIV